MKTFHLPYHFHEPQQALIMLHKIHEDLLKNKRTLLITGAGISTACGIPDYRTPPDTRLASGPGQYNRSQPLSFKPVTYASPSYTHLAITHLSRRNLFNFVLTQNVDNLHSKSLLSSRQLLEVHGNVCKYYCYDCDLLHYRNYYCRDRTRPKDSNHYNGHNCKQCGGKLMDSLIFFGYSYNARTKRIMDSLEPDSIIAVGTSLTIPSLQRLIKKTKAPLHLINIQKTAIEPYMVKSHVHCEADWAFRQFVSWTGGYPQLFRILYNISVEKKQNGYTLHTYDFYMIPVDVIKYVRIDGRLGYKLENCSVFDQIEVYLHSYHGYRPVVVTREAMEEMAYRNSIRQITWEDSTKLWKQYTIF